MSTPDNLLIHFKNCELSINAIEKQRRQLFKLWHEDNKPTADDAEENCKLLSQYKAKDILADLKKRKEDILPFAVEQDASDIWLVRNPSCAEAPDEFRRRFYNYLNNTKGILNIFEGITAIDERTCFVPYEQPQIVKINFPSTLRLICSHAFKGCMYYVSELDFSKITTTEEKPLTICAGAFTGNDKRSFYDLQNVKFPKYVEFVNYSGEDTQEARDISPFNQSAYLLNKKTFELSPNTTVFKFSNDFGVYLTFPNITDVTISDTSKISRGYFRNCQNLERVIMDDCVTEIENGAFAYCPSLKYIELSDNIRHIGANAFKGCPDIKIYCTPKTASVLKAEQFDSEDHMQNAIAYKQSPQEIKCELFTYTQDLPQKFSQHSIDVSSLNIQKLLSVTPIVDCNGILLQLADYSKDTIKLTCTSLRDNESIKQEIKLLISYL